MHAYMEQENRPIPVPGDGEIQIQVGVTGLCGSDREFQAWFDSAGLPLSRALVRKSDARLSPLLLARRERHLQDPGAARSGPRVMRCRDSRRTQSPFQLHPEG